MKRAFYTVLILMLLLPGLTFAQEETTNTNDLDAELEALLSGEEEVALYQFPEIKPSYRLSLGYRIVSDSGSGEAGEYELLDDSVTFGGEARVFRFPHRFYLVFEEQSRKDYFGELRYAYRDFVFFRWVAGSLFHNTNNVRLLDMDTSTAAPGVSVRDAGELYGVQSATERAFLRLKVPHFPAHAFVDYFALRKEGDRQQRSLLGSGWFNNVVRDSRRRDVDHEAEIYTVGANSHLNFLEAEYTHAEKGFEPGGDTVLYDAYTASPRPAGTYPHNQVPESEGSADTLKLHTSYTGKLVASATFSLKDRENETGGAGADYFLGAGGVSWMPATSLTFFLRYRHLENDIDNPNTVTITDTGTGSKVTSAVKPSTEYSSDAMTLIARYRPVRRLVLRGKFMFEDIRRKQAAQWNLPGDTARNTFELSAKVDLPINADLEASYLYAHTEDPAYVVDPDDLNEGEITLSWAPRPWVTALLDYRKALEDRDILNIDGIIARNREVDRDRFLGSGTVMLNEKVTLTASYSYLRNDIEQDIVYRDGAGLPAVDEGARHTESSQVYALDAYYRPYERLDLHGGLIHSLSRGTFGPGAQDLLSPVDVSEFSNYKFRETAFTASGDYRVGRGVSVSVSYKYAELDESEANPHDDIESGDIQLVMVMVEKKW